MSIRLLASRTLFALTNVLWFCLPNVKRKFSISICENKRARERGNEVFPFSLSKQIKIDWTGFCFV